MSAQLVIALVGTGAPIITATMLQRMIPVKFVESVGNLLRCLEMLGFGHWSAVIAVDFSWDIPVMMGTSGAVEASVAYYKQLYGFGLIPVTASLGLYFVYFAIAWRISKGGPGVWLDYFALASMLSFTTYSLTHGSIKHLQAIQEGCGDHCVEDVSVIAFSHIWYALLPGLAMLASVVGCISQRAVAKTKTI